MKVTEATLSKVEENQNGIPSASPQICKPESKMTD